MTALTRPRSYGNEEDAIAMIDRHGKGNVPPASPEPRDELIAVRGVSKSFGALKALNDVDLTLRAGEVHCLLGENGAGKSTLMGTIFGIHRPDAGEIRIRGSRAALKSPRDAIDARIGMVHQQFMLVPTLSVAENIILGEIGLFQAARNPARVSRLEGLVREYGFDVRLDTKVGALSLGQRQQVEILKLLYRNSEALILDEPTSVLTPAEVDKLFITLRTLVARGMGIILITHKLHEALSFGDRVTVMRAGKVVATGVTAELTRPQLLDWMFGQSTGAQSAAGVLPTAALGAPESGLSIDDVSVAADAGNTVVRSVNLRVRSGEIVGIAGVSGNGQREFAEAIAGVRPLSAGSIRLRGNRVDGLRPRALRELGLVYVPEERSAGLAHDVSIGENLTIADYHHRRFTRLGVLRHKVLREFSRGLAERFNLPIERLAKSVRVLSGGNQQRVILGRALAHDPACIIASQATIGLDLATSVYVHETLRASARAGGSVLYISTDVDELIGLADRIAVMFEGRIAGVVERSDFDKNTIGYLMAGGQSAT
ncbi:MAG TPA: ABC transporter ATP-binding protein [Bauldia sp.]|nr:ABC transporter ATP-binding protein [Bauldia sp.]